LVSARSRAPIDGRITKTFVDVGNLWGQRVIRPCSPRWSRAARTMSRSMPSERRPDDGRKSIMSQGPGPARQLPQLEWRPADVATSDSRVHSNGGLRPITSILLSNRRHGTIRIRCRFENGTNACSPACLCGSDFPDNRTRWWPRYIRAAPRIIRSYALVVSEQGRRGTAAREGPARSMTMRRRSLRSLPPLIESSHRPALARPGINVSRRSWRSEPSKTPSVRLARRVERRIEPVDWRQACLAFSSYPPIVALPSWRYWNHHQWARCAFPDASGWRAVPTDAPPVIRVTHPTLAQAPGRPHGGIRDRSSRLTARRIIYMESTSRA